jgi:hypothetical protein
MDTVPFAHDFAIRAWMKFYDSDEKKRSRSRHPHRDSSAKPHTVYRISFTASFSHSHGDNARHTDKRSFPIYFFLAPISASCRFLQIPHAHRAGRFSANTTSPTKMPFGIIPHRTEQPKRHISHAIRIKKRKSKKAVNPVPSGRGKRSDSKQQSSPTCSKTRKKQH